MSKQSSQATITHLRASLADVGRRRTLLVLLHQTGLLLTALAAVVLGMSLLSLWLPASFGLQLLLLMITAGASVALVWRYLAALRRLRADDRQLAGIIESRMPDLEQRLLTSLEFSPDSDASQKAGVSAQFVEQLWVDAVEHLRVQEQQLQQVSDRRMPYLSASAAALATVVTFIAFFSSEALLRAGAQLLWPFSLRPVTVELAAPEVPAEPLELVITVEPGDIRMQRGRSASINVRIENALPGNSIRLRMQSDQLNWYDVAMREEGSGSNGAAYSYYMPAVEEDLMYYVSIDEPEGGDGGQRSRQYSITLYDLPRAEQIDLAYIYPAYTGIENLQEEDGGDMVAPEGTEVALNVLFNKAVQQAEIVFDDDSRIPLVIDGLTGAATLTVSRDTGYRIIATDFDQLQSEDPDVFYIRSIPDQPPVLALHSPGRDQDVMPLEEVILQVEATDDYGLSEFQLHYSVVGTDEQAIDFLPTEQTRNITGNQMIFMEDLAVQPGDFVSYYMTLADNNGLRGAQQVVSDIYFLQVVPTDQEFRQASAGQQGGGGGGGGGGDNSSSALVTLQKDIIAATWRLRQQQLTMDQQQFDDDVAVLAESQREAMERAGMSIERLSERLDFADDSFANAVTFLQRAIEQMDLAAAQLDAQALTTAMQPEQQALQMVLRAEAEINRTDVNFQRQAGGGGGGGGQQEREDLRELFDMEMGQNENRYETPRQAGGGQQQNTEESSRLEELARRQESLTRAQRNLARRMEDMEEEQRRRELERLRREQEQLTSELAQLQQQMNTRQQMQQAQNSQQQGGQQSNSQASNEQMQRALQQMQEAAEAQSPAQAAARSQRALESLREQQRQMAEQPQNSANQLAQSIAQRGQQLIQQQRDLQQSLQQLAQEQGLGQTRQASSNSEGVQELVQQQERNRQELAEIERMLRAVIARASNEEQQLLSQAQQANRAILPLTEQMDTANRVLRNGMVNLAIDIEQEVADGLNELDRNLQALGAGAQTPAPTGQDPVMQAAADASALRQQLEQLQQEIDAREAGQSGEASIAQMREQLARSQQLAQQLAQQLEQADQQAGQPGSQQAGQRGQQAQQLAQQGQQGQPGQPGQPGQQQAAGGGGGQLASGPLNSQQRIGSGGIPEQGEAALWGNARSISSEISSQSLEAFMSQPELLRGLLQPMIELESDLRARAEMAQISQRLFSVSEEEIPDQYRSLVESYYRALSETGSPTQTAPSE